MDLRQEPIEMRIAVRGLQIQHNIKRLAVERKLLGIAFKEVKLGRRCTAWQNRTLASHRSMP